MAIFECAKCRDTCSVRFDDDVTEFCCGCAHDEIARLKAEVETRRIERDNARETSDLRATRIERMERALAAGPAALRDMGEDVDAELVEAVQAAAMKEGT